MNFYHTDDIPDDLKQFFEAPGQIGLEAEPGTYVEALVLLFRSIRDVLKDDGTLWLNLGDSYANDGKWGGHTGGKHAASLHCTPIGRMKKYTGLKPKDLIGIPWRVAFALQSDGWWLRQDIIWAKPNPMPESVQDRCTKSHEYIFLLSKSENYYYDRKAIMEPAVKSGKVLHGAGTGAKDRGNVTEVNDRRTRIGLAQNTKPQGRNKNKRDVWTVPVRPCKEAHFATFPPALITPCILAGSRPGDMVLDPFGGSGTTGMVATQLGRKSICIELNPAYCEIARRRTNQTAGLPLQTSEAA